MNKKLMFMFILTIFLVGVMSTVSFAAPTISVSDIRYGENFNITISDTGSGVQYFAVTLNSQTTAPTEFGNDEVVKGNVLNYWYKVSNTTSSVTVVFSGLDAGEYKVWAMDATGNYTNTKALVKKTNNPAIFGNVITVYTGEEQKLIRLFNQSELTGSYVYYSLDKELTEDNYTDGSMSRPSAIESGVYTVYYYCTGTSNYNAGSGSVVSKIYDVSWVTSSKLSVSLDKDIYVYDGTAKTPVATVTYGDGLLMEDTEYTVDYKNNVDVGTASVIITGIGAYKGTYVKPFFITSSSTENDQIVLDTTPPTISNVAGVVNGMTITISADISDPKVSDSILGSGVNAEKTKYAITTTTTPPAQNSTVWSASNVFTVQSVSTVYLWVKAEDNLGNVTISSKVLGVDITKNLKDLEASLSQNEYTYDGNYKEPSVTIKDGDKDLKLGEDYTVRYEDNKDAGTGKVIVTGKGYYEGEITLEFTIKKATASLTVNPLTISIKPGATATATITYVGDGTISVTSADSTIATASRTENTINIAGIKAGTTTITISVAGEKNYTAVTNKVITVYVQGTPTTPTITVTNTKGTVASGTWSNTDLGIEISGSTISGAGEVGYKYSYNGTTWQEYTGKITYSTDTNNGRIYAKAYNKLETSLESGSTYYEIRLDKTAPTNVTLDVTATTNKITLKVTSVDASVSGLDVYKFYLGNELKATQATNTYEYENLVAGTTYTVGVVVRDKAGNETTLITKTQATNKVAGEIVLTPDKTDWTNTPVTVTIKWPDTTLDTQIKIGDGEWTNYIDTKYVINSNTIIYARLTDGKNTGAETSLEISNIDTVKPQVSFDNTIVFGETLTITLTDNLAGVNAWQVTETDTVPTANWTTIIASTNTSVTYKPQKVGTYYVWAKDQAGNISELDDSKSFTVTAKDLSTSADISAVLNETTFTYDGTAKTPSATVKDGETTLKAGTDYEISYANNVTAGNQTASAIITGKNNYKGTITLKFTINKAKTTLTLTPISGKTFFGSQNSFGAKANVAGKIKVTSGDVTYVAIVSGDGATLVANSETTVTYRGVKSTTNAVVITVEFTPTDINNYETTSATYTVTEVSKTEPSLVANPDSVSVVVGETVTVIISNDGNGELIVNPTDKDIADATITGKEITISGVKNGETTITITLESDGNYGEKTITIPVTVTSKTLTSSDIEVTLTPTSYTYTGNENKPSVTVKDTGRNITLKENVDYTVSYKNNVNAGTAEAIITGKGDYTDSITKTFTINKANRTLTVSPEILNLKVSESKNVTLTYVGNGTVSVVATESSIASVNRTDNTVTVTANSVGTTTVTISLAEGDNYLAAESKTVTVNVCDAPSVPTITAKNADNVTVASGNWTNKDLTFSIAGSTVSKPGEVGYKYSLDGTTWTKYTTPFTYINETATVKVYAKAYNTIREDLESSVATYEIKLDKTAPTNVSVNATTTTNTITLEVTRVDGSISGVKEYEFYLDGELKATQTSAIYTYNGLNANSNYTVSVRVRDNASNITAENMPGTSVSIDTEGISDNIILTPDTTDWVNRNVIVTIEWPTTNLYKQIKINNGEWTNYEQNSYSMAANGTISARLSDGKNFGNAVSLEIKNIDKVSPSASYNATMVFGETLTITLTDDLSGVNAWQVTETNVEPASGWTTITASTNTNVTYKPSKVGNYYVWVKDQAGNVNKAEDNTAFSVTQKDISELLGNASLDQTVFTYDGTAKTPTATISHGSYKLIAGTDYTISYTNNINAGTATATITGKGNYKGSLALTFTINKAPITVTVNMNDYVYGETVATPSVNGNEGNGSVTYYYNTTNSNNGGTEWKNVAPRTLEVGTYYMYAVVSETANYKGATSVTTMFKVTKKGMNSSDVLVSVTIPEGGYIYNGTEIKPDVTVKDGITILEPGVDYDITYKDNVDAGTATIIITGKGNYEGVNEEHFIILQATPTITLKDKETEFTGNIITIDPAIVTGVTGGTVPDGEITYKYYIDAECSKLTGTANGATEGGAPSVSGTYYVKATIAASGNYTSATSNVAVLTIYGAPSNPTITIKDANNREIAENTWSTTNVTITIDGSAMLGAGEIIYEYSFDKISWTKYEGPFAYENETIQTLIYARAHNSIETSMKSDIVTRTLKIDKTAPNDVKIDAVTSDGNTYTSNWVNKNVILTFSSSDAISGVSHYLYRINDGEWINGNTMTIDTTGEFTVSVKAVDNAGLESSVSEKTVMIDQELPVVTGVAASGVTGRSEDITITATDAHSGIYKYALTKTDAAPDIDDDTAWKTSNIFTVEENATWYAWVIDVAGNISEQTNNSKITNTHVDRTPITMEATISTDNVSSLYAKVGDKIVVTMTANKNVGVLPTVTIAGQTAVISPTTIGEKVYEATVIVNNTTPEGNVTFNVAGYEDTIGNAGIQVTETVDDSKVYVDRTLPSTTKPEAVGISENKILVEAKQEDNLSATFNSGIAKIEYTYKLSTEDVWESWKNDSTITGLKLGTSYDIKTRVTDAAGNVSESEVLKNVMTKSLTSADISLVPDTTKWVNRDVIVTIYWPETTLDKYYRKDSDEWIKVDSNAQETIVTVEAYGQTVTAKLMDDYSNEVTNSITILNIDKEKPTVTATVSDAWTNTAKTIQVSGLDTGGSGIYGYYITSDEAYVPAFSDFVQNTSVSQLYTKEMGTYYIWIADVATNMCETPCKVVVKNIEREKPVISLVSVDKEIIAKNDTVTIVFKAKDNNPELEDLLEKGNIEIVVGDNVVEPIEKTVSAVNNGDEIIYTLILKGVNGDGTLKLKIDSDVVKDIAGNTNDETTLTTTIKVDNTAPEKPTVKVTPEGEVVNEDVVIEIVDPKDDEDYKYSTDGGDTWKDVPDDNKIIIDKENEGETDVIIKAVDDAGNESEETEVKVKIDITAPVLEDEEIVLPKGEDGEDKSNAKANDEVVIKIPITDENDVTLDPDKVKVTVGGEDITPDNIEIITDPETNKPTITITIIVDEGDEGEIEVDIEKGAVKDEAGNESEPKHIDTGVIADNTKPIVTITSPDGEYKSGDEIKYIIKIEEENPYEIDKEKITVDGAIIMDIFVKDDETVEVIVVAGDDDGHVKITVEEGFVTDEAENKNLPVSDSTVIVDNTPPILNWATINNGAAETDGVGVTVQVDALDADWMLVTNENLMPSDVAKIDDAEWIPYTSETIHELTQGDGLKTVYVWVKDNAGNFAGPAKPTITLNATVVGNKEDKITENGTETTTTTGTNNTIVKFKVTDTNFYNAIIESGMVVAFVDGSKCTTATFENIEGTSIENGITYQTIVMEVSGDGRLSLGLEGATVKDMAGNILSTTEKPVDTQITVDNKAPSLTVIANSITVNDTSLVGVTLNGALITTVNGTTTVNVPEGSIIKAIDKAGNTTTIIK